MVNLRIFLINLDKDKDRLAGMKAQLDAYGLPFERIDAIYGTAMPEHLRMYFLNADGSIASKLSPGEVGCYASHLMVMQRIAEGSDPVLVLEDDLEIAPDFPSILQSLDALPGGWDIIRLSNPYKRRYFPVAQITPKYQAVKFSRVPPSTGAYVVTPLGARKFLHWRQLRSLPVDQDMRRTWDCGLVTFGIYPRPIIPDIGASSIEAMSPHRTLHRRTRGGGFRDSLVRIVYDIRWLGMRNWVLSFLPNAK